MKKVRVCAAMMAAIAVISGGLSLSSFAGLAPFGGFGAAPETTALFVEEPATAAATKTAATAVIEATAKETAVSETEATETTEAQATETTEAQATEAEATKTAQSPYAVSETTEEDCVGAGAEAGDLGSGRKTEAAAAVGADRAEIINGAAPEAQTRELQKKPSLTAAPTEISASLNTDISGSLSYAGEVKNYNFTLSARGMLHYTFTHPATEDSAVWKVSLYQKYNSNGFDGEEKWRLVNVLETAAAKTSEASPCIGLQKGEYRVTVEAGKSFSAASYTLKAEFTPGASYEIEYNDAPARYTEICPGVPVKGSALNIKGSYDTDFYMFRLTAPGKISVCFEHPRIDTLSVYWRVVLFDENGGELYSENSFGSSEQLLSGDIGLDAGCYFIGVYNRVYTDSDYTLSVERKYTDCAETEPNGSFAAADVFALNSDIGGALTSLSGEADTDVYAVDITQPGYITLKFAVLSEGGENPCWRLLFCDSSGRRIRECVLSPDDGETQTAQIGTGVGRYYVVVDNNGLYKNSSAYTLSNAFTASTSWEREYNGEPACANPITDGVGMNGTVTDCEAEFDDDYFKFTLSSAAFVRVRLSHAAIDGDKNIFAVSVLDSGGKAVQLFDELTGGGLVSESGAPVTSLKSFENTENALAGYALSPGTYYIRVTSGLFSSDIRYLLTYTTKTGG